MLHRVNEDNLKLRAQIEKYAQADTELRNSRLRLERVLESIEAGFIAFDPAGIIFSVNQRAAELLNTDRQTLMDKGIKSLLTDDEENQRFVSLLDAWDFADDDQPFDAQDADNDARVEAMELLLHHPYGQEQKSSSKIVRFNTRIKLFGEDEATGVLFLEDDAPLDQVQQQPEVRDSVELVSLIGQAQQNIRRIGTRLNVLTPAEISQHPELIDRLAGIEGLINYIDSQLPSVSSEGEYRQQLVTLMRSALHTWEVTTQKTKIELAEESKIWAVSIDDGRLRTRTFDRYLRLEQLPKVPRWREVIRTAYFVLSNPAIEAETRSTLEAELNKTKEILKKAAIN
jgi:PAS domain-containing protein